MSWQPPPPPGRGQGSAGQPGSGQTGLKQAKPAQKSLYKLLQVDPDAHPTIIRYAYRFLAAMYHPDNADSGDTERFRLISEAWKTLSDATKRQAYDMTLGLGASTGSTQAAAGGALAESGAKKIPKASLSWSEVELRLAILQVLFEARRKKPETGGASARMLMDCINCTMDEIHWPLWYLREKGYIERTESAFRITVEGVDYIIDQLSRTQPLDDGRSSGPINTGSSLPAQLR